jgi:hypothetical protein
LLMRFLALLVLLVRAGAMVVYSAR